MPLLGHPRAPERTKRGRRKDVGKVFFYESPALVKITRPAILAPLWARKRPER